MLIWGVVDIAIIAFGTLAGMLVVFKRINIKMVLLVTAVIYYYNLPGSALRETILTRETAETVYAKAVSAAIQSAHFVQDTDRYWRSCGLTGSECKR